MYGEREVLRDFFDIYVSLSLSLSLYVGRVCWDQSIEESEKDRGDKSETSRMNWVEKTRMVAYEFCLSLKFVELYDRGPALCVSLWFVLCVHVLGLLW